MKQKEVVRGFNGKIIGSIETDTNGNKIVRDFYGKILGKYDKKSNLTRDFYGRILTRGDGTSMLLSFTRKPLRKS